MSVSVFRMNQEDNSFELGFEMPISNEEFYTSGTKKFKNMGTC